MNNIIKRVWNQNRMVNIEALSGMAFQAESGGHTFEISGVNDAGESVPLSGTVAGIFIRPDQTDVALTGSAEDGVVSVTLTDDCYAVAGRFGLTIFVTDEDDQKVAVYAAIGTVTRSTTGVVAGSTPQDVIDLINAIEAAVASIPASYSDLLTTIAPTYSDAALYPVGAYVWYNAILYRCIVPITTPETFTAAHWTPVVILRDLEDTRRLALTGMLPIDITRYIRTNCTVSASNKLTRSGTNYISYQIPCDGLIPKVIIKGNASRQTIVSFMTKFYQLDPTSGTDVSGDFATGETGRRLLSANSTVTLDIPTDCTNLMISYISNGNIIAPQSVTMLSQIYVALNN